MCVCMCANCSVVFFIIKFNVKKLERQAMLADIVCVATITLMTKLKKDLITTAKQTKKNHARGKLPC